MQSGGGRSLDSDSLGAVFWHARIFLFLPYGFRFRGLRFRGLGFTGFRFN